MSAFNGLLLVVGVACAVVNLRQAPKAEEEADIRDASLDL
jgi:hypothetical protein